MRLTALLLVAALLALPGAAADLLADPLTPSKASCGGKAPLVTQCGTGFHTRLLHLDVEALHQDGYTGVLVSRLITHTGPGMALTYEVACVVPGDGTTLCHTSGLPPTRGVPFEHRCASYDLPASLDPADATTLGGSGIWLCEVEHG